METDTFAQLYHSLGVLEYDESLLPDSASPAGRVRNIITFMAALQCLMMLSCGPYTLNGETISTTPVPCYSELFHPTGAPVCP